MREIRKISLIVILALSGGSLLSAKDCQNSLLTKAQSIKMSIEDIVETFVIPGDFSIGFNRIDKIQPSYDEAATLLELIEHTNTAPETMLQVFDTIVSLYGTSSIEEVIEIMEVALENGMQPIELAQALAAIQSDLLLIKGQLGFSEDNKAIQYKKATLSESLVLFEIASQLESLTKEEFRSNVDSIVKELETNQAYDVLLVLQVSQQLKQSVSDTIEQIQTLQELIYVDKRGIGFSSDMLNKHKERASIMNSVALLSLMQGTNLEAKNIEAWFSKYKAKTEFPSIDEFVGNLAQQVQAQKQQAMQKLKLEQERAIKEKISQN